MKKSILGFLGAAAMLVSLNSCDKTEGALYDLNDNKASFYSPKVTVPMEGGSVIVPLGRTTTSGELSVPVTLTAAGAGYTNIFKVAGPAVFTNGEGKAEVKVTYGDFSKIDASALSVSPIANNDVEVGLAFPFTLAIDSANLSVSQVAKTSVSATSTLEFADAGTAVLNSTGGWIGKNGIKNVKIQKAKTANVYKVVSPFGENSIAFMIKSDGKTVVFPNQVLGMNAEYGAVSMSNVTGTIAGKVVTLNVAGYTVAAGSFGSGVEIITLP